jgi:hypothetical protein
MKLEIEGKIEPTTRYAIYPSKLTKNDKRPVNRTGLLVLASAMGWGLALFVWGYALVWFLITDVLKILFYKHGGLKLIEEL